MRNKLTIILDECLKQIENGKSIEACLAEYPELQEKLEPLLKTGLSISSIPKVQPSPEFISSSRLKLMNRINLENNHTKDVKQVKRVLMLNVIPEILKSAWQYFISTKKVTIPVTIILLLILSGGLFQTSVFAPTTTEFPPAVLTILQGNVEIQDPGSATSQEGYDGMTLSIGAGIKTGPDSHAIITFFEGSTAKLEPDTYLEIKQLKEGLSHSSTIILKQWLGRTWNRVIKMADSGSRYEIETPSATAIVRGTLFTADVKGSGSTTVLTTEGLVGVTAQGKEVSVPKDKKTDVDKGENPSQPEVQPPPISQLVITVDAQATSSVIDPTGSSTGLFPTGEQFNQIQGSQSSTPSEETQIITIAEPMTGEYIIALRSSTEGERNFRIQGLSEGKTVFSYTGNWDAEKESGQLVHLNLQMEKGLIVGDEISLVEPLGDKKPEKVIERKPKDKEKQSDENPSGNSDEKEEEQETSNRGKSDTEKEGDDETPPEKDKSAEKKDKDTENIPGKEQSDTGKDKDDKSTSSTDKPDTGKDKDDKGTSSTDTPDSGKDSEGKGKTVVDTPDVTITKDDTDNSGKDKDDEDTSSSNKPDTDKDKDDKGKSNERHPDNRKTDADNEESGENTLNNNTGNQDEKDSPDEDDSSNKKDNTKKSGNKR